MEYKPNKIQLRYTSNKPPRDYRDIEYDYDENQLFPVNTVEDEDEPEGSTYELTGTELEDALERKNAYLDWYYDQQAKEEQAQRIQELLIQHQEIMRDQYMNSNRNQQGRK